MDRNWYAIYTKPRWEKKVAEQLKRKNINLYCPLRCVIKQWSDRRKKVYEPLFTSYVFVNINSTEMSTVLKTDGVLNLVYWLGKPAIIRNEEIDIIKRFMNDYENISIEKISVRIDDVIKINGGLLMGLEGNVLAVSSNKVKVSLPSLGYLMIAEVAKSSIVAY